MSASAVSQDVLQQHPKRLDLLEATTLFDTNPAKQTRNIDSDGQKMMTVSSLVCEGMYCMIGRGRVAGIASALRE